MIDKQARWKEPVWKSIEISWRQEHLRLRYSNIRLDSMDKVEKTLYDSFVFVSTKSETFNLVQLKYQTILK